MLGQYRAKRFLYQEEAASHLFFLGMRRWLTLTLRVTCA
ncbi:hypothetical protein [Bosea sp. BE125]